MKPGLKILLGLTAVFGTIGALCGAALHEGEFNTLNAPVYADKNYQCGGFINYGDVSVEGGAGHNTLNGTAASIVIDHPTYSTAKTTSGTHHGYSYTASGSIYGVNANYNVLKFGTSSATGTIIYTLNDDYTKFVVWATGWTNKGNPKDCTLNIGDKSILISGGYVDKSDNVTFTKYEVEGVTLDENHKLSISTTKPTNGDPRCLIASIAFYK